MSYRFKDCDLSERKGFVFYSSWTPIFQELDAETAKALLIAVSNYATSGCKIEPDFSDKPETQKMLLKMLFIQFRQQIRSDLIKYVATSLQNQLNIKRRWNKNSDKDEYFEVEEYKVLNSVELKAAFTEKAERYIDTGSYDEIVPDTTVYDRIPSNTSEYDRIRPYTNGTDIDKDVSVNKNKNVDVSESEDEDEMSSGEASAKTSLRHEPMPKPNTEQQTHNNKHFSFFGLNYKQEPTREPIKMICWSHGYSFNTAERIADDFISYNSDKEWKCLQRGKGWLDAIRNWLEREKREPEWEYRKLQEIHRDVLLETGISCHGTDTLKKALSDPEYDTEIIELLIDRVKEENAEFAVFGEKIDYYEDYIADLNSLTNTYDWDFAKIKNSLKPNDMDKYSSYPEYPSYENSNLPFS